MNTKKLILKCSICGCVKTERGWQKPGSSYDKDAVYSHGFCPLCFRLEVRKLQMRSVVSEADLYQ